MQMGSGTFDVEMFVLPGAAFGGKHSAPMDVSKVAVRKLIVSLRILILLVVDSQVPAAIFLNAVLTNELVLLLGRGPVLAPLVLVVGYKVPFSDEFFRVIKGPLIPLHCHGCLNLLLDG